MKMEITHYLPHEELKNSNYPELSKVESEISEIQVFAMRTNLAIADYNEGRADRIDIDIEELRKCIELCRYVGGTLGRSTNVCYDILMDIRGIQQGLHDLLFAYNRFGSEYVGTPTPLSEGGIG